MNNHPEDKWEILKMVEPTETEKSATRSKIHSTIRTKSAQRKRLTNFDWKYIVLTSLFLIISAGTLLHLQSAQPKIGYSNSEATNEADFTWKLEKVYSEKDGESYIFYKKNVSSQVGYAEDVTSSKKTDIFRNKPIHVEKELENFPYPTTLYIEHVKMQDVSLRYHFLVTAGEHITHFSFDYPKIDYAEIFQLVASLNFKGSTPYKHGEQLYVTHGYDTLPYPVGIEPVNEYGENTEKYTWEKVSKKEFSQYLEKIKSTGEWKEKQGGGKSYTFESVTGYVIVKITLDGKKITYEYSYPKQEE